MFFNSGEGLAKIVGLFTYQLDVVIVPRIVSVAAEEMDTSMVVPFPVDTVIYDIKVTVGDAFKVVFASEVVGYDVAASMVVLLLSTFVPCTSVAR